MFLKAQLQWNVIIPAENLDAKGLALQKAIIVRLLDEFSAKKATSTLGYFLAVTTLDKVGEGKVRQHSGDVLFPVTFSCITYKAFAGEILEGEVHKILKHGVFLRCGPVEHIYLSHLKMQGYSFVPGIWRLKGSFRRLPTWMVITWGLLSSFYSNDLRWMFIF